MTESRDRYNWWMGPLAAALALGAWQRCSALTRQVPAGDEWHAITSALEESYRQLLTSFSTAATPLLSLLYKLMAEIRPLDELAIRLPILLCGLLLPALSPLLLPRLTEGDRQLRWLFAALLALSPVLVYYSRFARPYAPALLFALLAVLAFCRYWLEEQPGWPWLYWLCAALAPAWHATTLPAVLAPLAWAAADGWFTSRGKRLPRLAAVLAATLALIALPLILPLINDWNGLFYRAGQHRPSLLTLREILPLLAGSGSWLITGAFCLVALVGVWQLLRLAPRFAACLLSVTAISFAAIFVSAANSVHIPIVFFRYSLILLPIFLLFVAAGVALPLRHRPRLQGAALIALPLLGYLTGPLPGFLTRVHSFTSHPHYQYSYREGSPFSFTRRPSDVSAFYQELARLPAGLLVVAEGPYHYPYTANSFVYGQEIHQQWVRGGLLGELCHVDSALRLPEVTRPPAFRQLVDVSQKEAMLEAGVDLVILHHNLSLENAKPVQAGAFVPPPRISFGPLVERCIPRYAERLGAPIYQDRWISVFDISGRYLSLTTRPASSP